jgi:hypothetical protein
VSQRLPGQAIDLVAVALDPNMKERADHRQHIEIGSPNAPAGAVDDDGFTVFSRFSVAPGTYEVRVSGEFGGDVGTVFAEIIVPAFARNALSASTLVLSNEPAGAEAPRIVRDLLPVLLTTVRTFAPNDHVVGFLRVYAGGSQPPHPVSVDTDVLDSVGKTVFQETTRIAAERFGTGRAADYQVNVPIQTLASGPHLLRVTLTSGEDEVHREVPFTVP